MSPHLDSFGSSSQPVCEEVCALLSSIVDGRATSTETAFVNAHLARCPECASQFAFLRATKTAWAKQPLVMPPSDLSARIAAATYRKPTFAQRFTGFFAFLAPAPVRVLVGAAAVAGVAYVALPRLTVAPVAEKPAPVTPANVPTTVAQTIPKSDIRTTTPVQSKPVAKQPVIAAAKPKPQPSKVAAPAPVVPKVPVETTIAVANPVMKPAPVAAPKPAMAKPVLVASAAQAVKHAAAHTPVVSEQAHTLPKVHESTGSSELVAHQSTNTVEKPQVKEPPITKSAPLVAAAASPEASGSAVAVDPDPMSTSGFMRLGDRMKTIQDRAAQKLGGTGVKLASESQNYAIVSAPMGSGK